MINVRELRIGNYVLAHNGNYDAMEVRCVFNIQNDSASIERKRVYIVDGRLVEISINENERYIYPTNPCVESCMEPVLITGDILLRCGFIYNENARAYTKYRFMIKNDDTILVFIGSDTSGVNIWSEVGIEIRSLHQLQNLFYDVTGEDFIVNLSADTEEH